MSVCPWNTNVIMAWARMLERCKNPGVLQISILQAHWHGCSGERMLLEHERCYGFGMDALVSVCSWNTVAVAHSQNPKNAGSTSGRATKNNPHHCQLLIPFLRLLAILR